MAVASETGDYYQKHILRQKRFMTSLISGQI